MIKSEREYGITKDWVTRFEESIDGMGDTPGPGDNLDPFMRDVVIRSQQSMLDDLKSEVTEYESLRAGEQKRRKVGAFNELPDALISGRIAAGLTQKQLAERMGLKEQQIQRYEATEYRSASLERVGQVVAALGLTFRADVRFAARKTGSARS